MHVRQPEVPPRIPVREPLVVEPKQVQDRRVQVVHVHPLLHRIRDPLRLHPRQHAATCPKAEDDFRIRGVHQSPAIVQTASPTTSQAFGSLKFTRIDPQVNFSWGNGSPSSAITTDSFAVRWTGQVETRFDDTYTFSMEADDGVRLWIDGALVLDSWKTQWVQIDAAPITLTAGKHDIQLDYYEGAQGAVAKLYWRSTQASTRELIPQAQLYSTTSTGTPIYAAASTPSGNGAVFSSVPVRPKRPDNDAGDEAEQFDLLA